MLALLTADTPPAKATDLVAGTDRFTFHDNPWINEHHFLFHVAKNDPENEALEGLDDGERALFEQALAHYRETLIDRDLLFDGELYRLKRWLGAQPPDEPLAGRDELATTVDWLRRVRPVYERRFWPVHSARNRETLERWLPTIRRYEPAVVARMQKWSANEFPETRARVDLTYHANWAGAYTTNRPDVHIVISSDDHGPYGSWLELLFHESSHRLISPRNWTVAETIGKVSGELEVEADGQLWHAILFYVAGRAVEESVEAERDEPYTLFMFEFGIFTTFHAALRQHFEPYIRGEVDLETAIRGMLLAGEERP